MTRLPRLLLFLGCVVHDINCDEQQEQPPPQPTADKPAEDAFGEFLKDHPSFDESFCTMLVNHPVFGPINFFSIYAHGGTRHGDYFTRCVHLLRKQSSEYRNKAGGDKVLGEHFPLFLVERHDRVMLLPALDISVSSHLRNRGKFVVFEELFLEKIAAPGSVVVEVGANVGAYTVPLAKKVGQDGQIIAFEPFKTTYQILVGNVALSGLENVICENFGIGDQMENVSVKRPDFSRLSNPGAMQIFNQPNETGDRFVTVAYDSRANETIKVRRLDSFEFPRKVSLLKIDAEGMEPEVVRGAQFLIRRDFPIVYAENNAFFEAQNDRTFLEFMEKTLGYSCAVIEELMANHIVVCIDQNQRAVPEGSGEWVQRNAQLEAERASLLFRYAKSELDRVLQID